jgi:two-component system, sensor histidine kinase PdtaS
MPDIVDLDQDYSPIPEACRWCSSDEDADRMTSTELQYSPGSSPKAIFGWPELWGASRRSVASYERELSAHKDVEFQLRAALARDAALLRQKDTLIRQQELLSKESDHRLLNGLQMIVSMLSLQSRIAANAETASQLAIAGNRVAMIERVHRRLHSFDGVQNVAFKYCLEDLCHDLSKMLSTASCPELAIKVETIELDLPAVIGAPLAFVVNELVTNAAKHGRGRITVRLEAAAMGGYALSVSNDGPVLPEGFDPAASKGLGLKIIRFFVERIGGALQFGPGDNNQGARFSVLFSLSGRKPDLGLVRS